MARPAETYRAAGRNKAHAKGVDWRTLPRRSNGRLVPGSVPVEMVWPDPSAMRREQVARMLDDKGGGGGGGG